MRILLSCLIAHFPLFLTAAPANSQSPLAPATEVPAASCQSLADVTIPNTGIAMATLIPAGTFNGPPQPFTGQDMSSFYAKLPGFCRLIAHAHPSADSDIVVEVWLPQLGWNGRLQGLGNGGFAGQIDYFELGAAISKGYVAVATDTGHAGSSIDSQWALGHPEKIVDFGHRGIHEMTRVAKLFISRYYGSAVRNSYFAGCSDGGREALMEAERYPEDYDGILAGAPANYWTALLSSAAVDTQALSSTPGSFIPQSKIPVIANAVLAACDSLDGVRDGILNDPRQCHFDPVTIQCKPGDDLAKCLTAPQVTALKAIYAGLHDSSGRSIFPGYLPGAEGTAAAEVGPGGWDRWITGPEPGQSFMAAYANGYFSDMVNNDPHWDIRTFSLATDLQTAKQKTADALDAVNPDLSKFQSRGGKLILYHGWNDPAIPALSTVNFYTAVVARLGDNTTNSFLRLYMLPGVQHCAGGPGADNIGSSGATAAADPAHNVRLALESWVEKGLAPKNLIATKGGATGKQPVMTRLLCPFPQSAQYDGTGDSNTAESYVCTSAIASRTNAR